MTEMTLPTPVELTDAELDQVSAGQVQAGLVNVVIKRLVRDINILNKDRIFALNHDLNNNQVNVGLQAAIAALSGVLQGLEGSA
jgi:hypothetical protein